MTIGDILYLRKKANKASKDCANKPHEVQPGQSMYDISQMYGIRLKNLYKLNNLSPKDYEIKVGDLVFVSQLGKNAVVEKILKNKDKAIVKSGLVSLTVEISSLYKSVKEQKTKEITVKKPNRVNNEPFNVEINLIWQILYQRLYLLNL